MRALMKLLAVFLVLFPLRAGANTGAVVIVGKSDEHARELTEKAVATALTKADWKLLEKQLQGSETSSISRCFTRPEPQRCILQVVQHSGVDSVAYVSVDPDPTKGDRSIKLTGRIITTKLDLVMIASRFCDHCTDDTLAGSATDLMKELLDRVAVTSGRTVLSVKSSPQGGRYAVDGTFVGITDASIDVTPGPHTVTVELDGYETFTQNVNATEGKTAEVSATFRRLGTDSQNSATSHANTNQESNADTGEHPDMPQRSRAAKPLLVIGGVAIVAGVVTLFLDQKPTTSAPHTDQEQWYYDTTTPGLITIAGGVVLAGVGGYLYWKGSRSTTTASVRPTSGGAMMTLSASF